ncbi:hypothetical protein ACEPAF_4238 [Sanghuangporus sanghuang]
MYVRILDKREGNGADFEFDIEYSHLTPEIKRAVQELISKETGIEPDNQNAVFLQQLPDTKDIKKLTLPSDVERLTPAPKYQNALNTKYPENFDQSTVYVSRIGDWDEDDFRKPKNRMKIRRLIDIAGVVLQTLYSELNRPRTVDTSLLDQFPDFQKGIEQILPDLLAPIASASSDADVTPIELKCYVNLFDDIIHGITKFDSRTADSSPLHTLFFGSRMIEPPFFSDEHRSSKKLEMTVDLPTDLRLFIKTSDAPQVYRFTPRSDLAVIDKLSRLPALICEVDSHAVKKYRARMIMQGVVACRQWRYILPDSLKEKNKILALFVNDDFFIDLYLFHSDENYDVEIYQDGFFLGQRNEALRLARILFNYRDKFLDVAGLSEQEKITFVKELISDSKALESLTSASKKARSRKSRQSSRRPNLATIPESHTDALLLSAEVQSLLCPEGACLQATEYESVAAVRTVEVPSDTVGFVKLTNKYELDAFDTIRNSGSEFLLTRIVLPTKVIEVSGCSVAFLPFGGEPLLYSWGLQDGPAGHETEIAWDLLTIISRLHELHIAHLDIKPTNILWDPSTHSIRVIDFDSSEKLDPNGSRKIRGIFGTSGFAAPEVESEEGLEYDPFLADAFSCGQVLLHVVMGEKMTEEAKFVREVAKSLSKADVNERWSINKAINVWVDWLAERGDNPDRADCRMADTSCLLSEMLPLSAVCVH